MHWIDDDFQRVQQLSERAANKTTSAYMIFDDLWKEVLSCLARVETKGHFVHTNGSPHDRIVTVNIATGGVPLKQPSEMHIRLDKKDAKIEARWGGGGVVLDVEVGEDNVGYLTHGGKRVDTPEAAKIILEPFLFPILK